MSYNILSKGRKATISVFSAMMISLAFFFIFSIILYSGAIITDNTLIGHWKDIPLEGFTIEDLSVYERNAYIYGDYRPEYNKQIYDKVDGKEAFFFNNRNEKIKIPIDSTIKNSGTISIWAYTHGLEGKRPFGKYYLFGHLNHETTPDYKQFSNNLQVYVDNTSKVALRFGNEDLESSSYTSSKMIYENTWNHIIITWEKRDELTYMKLCTSAISFTEVFCEDFRLFSNLNSINSFAEIGNSAVEQYYEGWQGYITDVRIYNRPLVIEEITKIHLEEAKINPSLAEKHPYVFSFAITFLIIFLVFLFLPEKDLDLLDYLRGKFK